jgi:hypothetical protein
LTLPAIYVAPDGRGPPGITLVELPESPPEPGTAPLPPQPAAFDVVGTVTGFPSHLGGQLFVVAIEDLETVLAAAGSSPARWARPVRESWTLEPEVWGRGDLDAVLGAVQAAGLRVSGEPRTAAALLETPAYASVRWTFGLLQGFSLLAAIVTLAAVLLYAVTRQQARAVSYALARRMGLRRSAHLTATMLELTMLLLVAYVAGILLAVASALLVVPRLDPLPALPPRVGVLLPIGELAVAGLILPIVALVAAMLIQYRSDRADIAEVLRHAG